ncbi:sensor histidine kinase [Chitinibacteraceae bacterium HSL-7]
MSLAKPTLQRQLLTWLLIPQLIVWIAAAALFYAVATHYTRRVVSDRLHQVAHQLADQIRWDQGHPVLNSPLSTVRMIAAEASPDTAYSVRDGRDLILAAQAAVPNSLELPQKREERLVSTQVHVHGTPWEVVTLYRPAPTGNRWLVIEVGRAVQGQRRLSAEILAATVVPLGILVALVSVFVYFGIRRGLAPLKKLSQQLDARDPNDMAPFELDDAPEELQTLTRALNQLLSTTNDSVARQRRFIADAAHQLRTPLAGLKSQTELAMRETTPQGLRERLNLVHASATRSIHLVNQLLTLARSEPNNPSSAMLIAVDLAKLLRELTAECVPRALAAGMDLGCDCELMEAPSRGNPALLRELFLNLIENAIKYSPRNASITVRLETRGKFYQIDVEDNGPGIAEEHKARIFERFYRINQNDGNGCGLGMAIVKEIVERHGGQVSLHDAEPHGLIVRILLPAAANE